MLPQDLTAFFTATAGAAAAFIGLLFVALTVALGRPGHAGLVIHDKVLADGAYLAFINILFVSFVGLLPQTNLGGVFTVMGFFGVSASVRVALSRNTKTDPGSRNSLLDIFIAVIYIAQLATGIFLILNRGAKVDQTILFTIIFSLFGIGLGRSWGLTGFDDDRTRRDKTS